MKVRALLACGHWSDIYDTATTPAPIGGIIYCAKCDSRTRVERWKKLGDASKATAHRPRRRP